MSQVMEEVVDFDSLLAQIAKENFYSHKRLKFVNRSLVDFELVEFKLHNFMMDNLPAERMDKLCQAVVGCHNESRICEYLIELIRLGEERIDAHAELFNAIKDLFRQAIEVQADEDAIEAMAERCSLAVYDSMQFLVAVKRVIAEVATIYHVPYYYETERETIRIRASLLSTHKNVNTIIDDLLVMSEALWMARNPDVLEEEPQSN